MLLKLCRVGALLVVVAAFGCEQPVKWTYKQEIDPDPGKIGKKLTVYCTVTGDLEKVGWISAVPLVAPEFAWELKDNGKEADKKAGDGVYSATGIVPAEAEPGLYEIECTSFDKNGDPLRVPSFTVLDKHGKVTQEVVPQTGEDGKKETSVEATSIIVLTVE